MCLQLSTLKLETDAKFGFFFCMPIQNGKIFSYFTKKSQFAAPQK